MKGDAGALSPGRPAERVVIRAAARAGQAVLPLAAGLALGAAVLVALGRNPLAFYSDLFSAGLFSQAGLEASLTRLAPLLLIGIGYIVAFRAGLWNIGGDGQFLMAAAVVAGTAPLLVEALPRAAALILLAAIGFAVGGGWALLPAYLRAWHGMNEIITSVMMSYVGINLANLLIKGPWRSAETNVPQTQAVPLDDLLPRLGTSSIHIGLLVALLASLAVWYALRNTSTGLRLSILGASPRLAGHAGLPVKRLILGAFFFSGGFVGLGASIEILGVWGYMRADWNPQFGLALFGLVFLGRLSPLAVIPLAFFYAVLEIGGRDAVRKASLDYDFILILIALMLITLAVSRYLNWRRTVACATPALPPPSRDQARTE